MFRKTMAAVLLTSVLVMLAGCVANRPYRTTIGECQVANCTTGSIESHPVKSVAGASYLLGVVEFDDQGSKLLPRQMDALFERLRQESQERDLSIVVFVHGWKHNGGYDDPHLDRFRDVLERLAGTEQNHAPGAWGKPRKVVGIYAGWRGRSVDAGDLENLTFWTRKAAAQRVAQGSIRELLGRARGLRDTIDRTTWSGQRLRTGQPAPPGDPLRSTRLMTIGHSFGGLIVYTALAQYLTDQAAASAMVDKFGPATDEEREIAPYGDLVVIVNPAVEAISWEPIRQLVKDRPAGTYARRQKPVFLEITSTADDATGRAFPLGRLLNTAVENFTGTDQRQEARTAVGHYEPFLTHDLTLAADADHARDQSMSLLKVSPEELVRMDCAARSDFERNWMRDGYLQPGWTRRYSSGALLTHRIGSGYDPNNPFWIIQTDKSLIADHSDITQLAFVDFIRQVYDELLLGDRECTFGPATRNRLSGQAAHN